MKDKKLLSLMVVTILLVAAVGTIWALNAVFNRPVPLMDYAPQEIGIYDTRYDNLGEMDCRGCHGDSLADRHHYSETVIIYGLCTPCHEIIPDPPGVVVTRDCTTSGCHSWSDISVNGWHHNTNLSSSENCVACHDRNLVAEITPFSSFVEYPPSVVTPTPFSCENCHWDQNVVAATGDPAVDPSFAGHPSTYDHYNQWGQFVGYYEYGKPILGNFDTHHMGFEGNVASQCWKCHSNDPGLPSWDPYNPELIRYCEICHDISTLHTIEPHVGTGGTGNPPAVDGWDAVGFHDPDSGSVPSNYRTFYANEQCFGCHGDLIERFADVDPNDAPHIDAIAPKSVCPTGQVELTGQYFGDEWIPGRTVQIKEGTDWISAPIYSWTESRIVIEIPGWTYTPGNHNVRVRCEDRSTGKINSNILVLTILDCSSPQTISPDSGPCITTVKLENGTGLFGTAQDEVPGAPNGDGVYHVVQIVSSQGAYIALNMFTWSNSLVKFNFKDFFEDLDGDFFQDLNEPTISVCDGLGIGTWDVFLKYIFYNDTDGSTSYTNGDALYQVETSDPITFELTNDPYITQLNPSTEIANFEQLNIYGINFGPTQTDGEVRVGKKVLYDSDPLNEGKVQVKIKAWSNTRIKFTVKVGIPAWLNNPKLGVWVIKDGKASNFMNILVTP